MDFSTHFLRRRSAPRPEGAPMGVRPGRRPPRGGTDRKPGRKAARRCLSPECGEPLGLLDGPARAAIGP